jgi:hypothetical protein
MSQLGQKQTSTSECSMSTPIPKADIQRHDAGVRLCHERKSKGSFDYHVGGSKQ